MDYKVKQMTTFGDIVAATEKSFEDTEKKDTDYTYDGFFKKLFANKVFIAPILKNVVP